MPNYLDIALKYHEAGHRIIPVNSEKNPAVSSWKEYMKCQTKEDVVNIFSKDCYGIAMIMGNGIEAIDIDQKYDLTGTMFSDYVKYLESFDDVLVTDLVVQSTMNGGYHLIYKCEEVGVNTKLAFRPATDKELKEYNDNVDEYNKKLKSEGEGKVEQKHKTDNASLPLVLFETRGDGGYILIEPSPGYKIDNGNIFDIPTIGKESRQILLNAAKSFNEVHLREDFAKATIRKKEGDVTPLNDYDDRGDVPELVQRHGWVEIGGRNERIYFRRPGKKRGNSGDYHTGKRLFKTWSSSTVLEQGKAYSPAGLYAVLEHDGDFSKAAKELYRQGYGVKKTMTKEEEGDMFSKFLKTRFDIHKPPKNVDVVFKIYSESECYDVGGLGMFGLIKGREKARKTTLGATILASAINGGNPLMNMELKIGNRLILHFDTEQSDYFYYQTQKRTLNLGGKNDNHPNFYSFSIKQYSIEERMMLIDKCIDHFSNVGVIILDGLLDLCSNMNNEEKAMQTIQKVTEWRDRSGAMVLGVMHMNRGANGDTIGHIGAFANRKCDFSIEINLNKETNYSQVKPAFSRFRPFVGFEFTQDKKGIPVLNGSMMNILGNIDVSDDSIKSSLINHSVKDDDIPF